MLYAVYFLILATIVPFAISLSNDNLVQTLSQWVPKEAGFFAGSCLVLSMSIFKGKQNVDTFNNKWIAALFVYVVLHFIWKFYIPIISMDISGRHAINYWTMRPFLNILLGILLIKTLVENFSVGEWIKVSKFLCWVGFILSVYSIFQWFGVDQIFLKHYKLNHSNGLAVRKDFMMTFFTNHILSSNYIALVAPLCLMFKEPRYKIFFVVMAVSVCMADSLTSYAALVVAVLAYLGFCSKLRTLILVGILIVILSIVMNVKHKNYFSFNGRMALWKDSINLVLKKNPYTGFGIGSYPKKHKLGTQIALSAHNEFAQSLSEGGVLFIIIIVGYLVTFFRRAAFSILNKRFIMTICFFCGFLGVFVISNGSFPFRFAPLATLGILYIANLESLIGGNDV